MQQTQAGCFDISGVDINANPTLKVQVNHTRGGTAPTVNQIKATWNPITFLLFDKVAPEEIGAGQTYAYKVRVSANFVDAQDLVIWDVLPKLSRGTVTYEAGEDYGQDDAPTLAITINPDGSMDTLISRDGQYTDVATTVNGVAIPEHAIYWTFDELTAGKSIILQAFMVAPNGTLDGTQYINSAEAVVANGANKSAAPVTTTVRSTPAPLLKKEEVTIIRPGETRIFPIGGENLVLEGNTLKFYIQDPIGPADGNNYAPELRERMYNTLLWDDVTELVPYLGATPFDIMGTKFNANGTSTSISGTYTAVPITINNIDVPANSVYWDLETMHPGDGYAMTFKVTLDAPVPDGTEFTNHAFYDSDQTELLRDSLPMTLVSTLPGSGNCCVAGYFPTYPGNEQDLSIVTLLLMDYHTSSLWRSRAIPIEFC